MNSHPLSTLAQTPADKVKALAEDVLAHMEQLGAVETIQNRTGIVMLPAKDSVQGTPFYLGEVLVAESHLKFTANDTGKVTEGYAACMGRDLQQATALAVLDCALRAQVQAEWIHAFIAAEANKQKQADQALLAQVESTRVQMETF